MPPRQGSGQSGQGWFRPEFGELRVVQRVLGWPGDRPLDRRPEGADMLRTAPHSDGDGDLTYTGKDGANDEMTDDDGHEHANRRIVFGEWTSVAFMADAVRISESSF